MKKAIRSLSIVALVIAALSLVGFAVLFALRNVVGALYTLTTDNLLPVIPVANLVSVLGAVLVCLLVALSANSKTGIWAEILLIIVTVVLIPVVISLAGVVQTSVSGRFGVETVMSLSVMNNVTSFAASGASTARMLALVICGMSIASKKLTPKSPLYPPIYSAPQQPYPAPQQQPPYGNQ